MFQRELIHFYTIDKRDICTPAYHIGQGVYVHRAWASWGKHGEGYDPLYWSVTYQGYMVWRFRSLINAVQVAREIATLFEGRDRELLLLDLPCMGKAANLINQYDLIEENAYDWIGWPTPFRKRTALDRNDIYA